MADVSDELSIWAGGAAPSLAELGGVAEDDHASPLPDGIGPLVAAFKEVARASGAFDAALANYTKGWTLALYAERFRQLCCAVAADASAVIEGNVAAKRAELSRVYKLVSSPPPNLLPSDVLSALLRTRARARTRSRRVRAPPLPFPNPQVQRHLFRAARLRYGVDEWAGAWAAVEKAREAVIAAKKDAASAKAEAAAKAKAKAGAGKKEADVPARPKRAAGDGQQLGAVAKVARTAGAGNGGAGAGAGAGGAGSGKQHAVAAGSVSLVVLKPKKENVSAAVHSSSPGQPRSAAQRKLVPATRRVQMQSVRLAAGHSVRLKVPAGFEGQLVNAGSLGAIIAVSGAEDLKLAADAYAMYKGPSDIVLVGNEGGDEGAECVFVFTLYRSAGSAGEDDDEVIDLTGTDDEGEEEEKGEEEAEEEASPHGASPRRSSRSASAAATAAAAASLGLI